MRLLRHEYFIKMAELTAKRSACLSRQVGAVIVSNNRIISTGYNGPLPGNEHCKVCKRTSSGLELNTCPAIHAEANAVMDALKHNLKVDETSIIYCTTEPCIECTKLIALLGIKRIIYLNEYRTNSTCDKIIRENKMTKEQYIG